MGKPVPLSEMPLRARHWYIFAVSSLEQLIGAALSTIVGVMIPLILLIGTPRLSAFDQGLMGASGLVGIAAGSAVIGALMDASGYLFWFRFCPALIAAASAGVYFSGDVGFICLFLFLIGAGVGGGYSLDSAYISEIMPKRWKNFFVGLAKATCALGFIGGAAVSYLALIIWPDAEIWHDLILFIGTLGIITLILRIRWYQSPRWLLIRGENAKAQKAAKEFLGPNAEVVMPAARIGVKPVPWTRMFNGPSLDKVIFSGVTWACEGLGVYGFGVFLPILVMALGIGGHDGEGIPKVLDSVKMTVFINIFIAAGFAIGLSILHKVNIAKLMGWSFVLCAISLGLLLTAYKLGWGAWISILGFVLFETALNAGPHLVTYIVPSAIYSVDELGAGTGIATMFGKVGAVLGVFFMPSMLSLFGAAGVLWISIAVQLLGATITFIYGKKLKLL